MTALTYLNSAMSLVVVLVLIYALMKLSRNPEMRPVTIPALAVIILFVALMTYIFVLS